MPSNNYGSAILIKTSAANVAEILGRPGENITGRNVFLLGTNLPYGKLALPADGDLVALDDKRIDNYEYGVGWNPSATPGMALCFGYARSGKNTVIVPAGINYGGNMFFFDPKGELSWLLTPRRKAMGHKVARLDPFGEVHRGYEVRTDVREPSTKYNPLSEIDPESINFADDLAAVGESLTIPGGDGEDASFFFGSARDCIVGVTGAVILLMPKGQATLREVRKVLTLDKDSFQAWVIAVCDKFPDSLPTRKLRQFRDMHRTNLSILGTAKEQTNFLDSEQLLCSMEPAPGEETFSFRELATGKLDVFVVLPGIEVASYSRWTRLMVNLAMRFTLRERAINPKWPVVFMLDEAGTALGHLKTIEDSYGLNAGLGIVCWSFYQGISQLKRDYKDSWQTFINNSACIQITGVGDLETANYFSEFMGQDTVHTESTSRGQNFNAGAHGGSQGSSFGTNRGEMPRRVMLPQELMHLDANKLIVLLRKVSPILNYKVRYFEDARFNGLYRPDPTHPWKGWPGIVTLPNQRPLYLPKFLENRGITMGHITAAWLGLWLCVAFCVYLMLSAGFGPMLFLFFLALAFGATGLRSKNRVPYTIERNKSGASFARYTK